MELPWVAELLVELHPWSPLVCIYTFFDIFFKNSTEILILTLLFHMLNKNVKEKCTKSHHVEPPWVAEPLFELLPWSPLVRFYTFFDFFLKWD